MTQPLLVDERDLDAYVGARFLPGAASVAFNVPASELTDQLVRYREITPLDGALEDTVAIRGAQAGLAGLVHLVRERLAASGGIPVCVQGAVQRIRASRGNLRIARLASELGVSRQNLARQFSTHVGITPKTLARVVRARAAVALAERTRASSRAPDWSRVALDLGYFDQPHFIEEFKEIVGLTPGEWSRTNPLPD
jgi:AraC-like DNA-binding protein